MVLSISKCTTVYSCSLIIYWLIPTELQIILMDRATPVSSPYDSTHLTATFLGMQIKAVRVLGLTEAAPN